jgi:tetratricopeptide (TPR) repeat protein
MRQQIKWLPLMLCIWSAAAYPSSVIQHAEKLLASHQPERAYQWLNQHQEQLNGSAKDLYVYGLLALRLGHKQQAFITLEKVVELVPNNLAAQLDLAIAAIQVGRLIQAERLLSSLAQRQGNPNGVDLLIASYRMKIKDQLQPLQQGTTSLELAAGYNNNMNLGLLTKQVMLDTVDGQLSVNINDSSRAIADQYHRISFTHYRTWNNLSRTNKPWPDFSIAVKAETTNYTSSQHFDTASIELSVAKALTVLAQPSQVTFATQLLTLGGQVSQDWRVKAKTVLPSSQMLEIQLDQHDKVSVELFTHAPWLGASSQWFVGLEKNKVRSSFLGVTIPWAVRNDIHLDSGVTYTESEDLKAYSPTILGDKKKMTQTLAINTKLWRAMGQDQRIYANLMWQNQTSNIALFGTRWAAIEIGLTKQFK